MAVDNDLGYAEIRKIFDERDRRAAINGANALKTSSAVYKREPLTSRREAGQYERTPQKDEFTSSRKTIQSSKNKGGKRLQTKEKVQAKKIKPGKRFSAESRPCSNTAKSVKLSPRNKLALILAIIAGAGMSGYAVCNAGQSEAAGDSAKNQDYPSNSIVEYMDEGDVIDSIVTEDGGFIIDNEIRYNDAGVNIDEALDETGILSENNESDFSAVEHVSDDLIEFLKSKESFQPEAYYCPAGKLTIGWGHTKDVYEGQVITEEEGTEFLREDVEDSEKSVLKGAEKYNIIFTSDDNTNVPDGFKVYSQGVFDALVDFRYNLGPGGFADSGIMEILAEDDVDAAIEHLLKFVKAKNSKTGEYEVLPGLVTRRQEEADMMRP